MNLPANSLTQKNMVKNSRKDHIHSHDNLKPLNLQDY